MDGVTIIAADHYDRDTPMLTVCALYFIPLSRHLPFNFIRKRRKYATSCAVLTNVCVICNIFDYLSFPNRYVSSYTLYLTRYWQKSEYMIALYYDRIIFRREIELSIIQSATSKLSKICDLIMQDTPHVMQSLTFPHPIGIEVLNLICLHVACAHNALRVTI